MRRRKAVLVDLIRYVVMEALSFFVRGTRGSARWLGFAKRYELLRSIMLIH
jgi:hypothetical protein